MASMERWHIGKTITFGNLLTGLAAIAAIAVFLFDQNNRISILETRADESDRKVAAVQESVNGGMSKIMTKLDSISDKQYYHLENHSPDVTVPASPFGGGGSGSSGSN